MGLHYIGGGGARPVYVGTTANAGSAITYTFTNHAIGDAHASRYVVVCISWSNGLSSSRPLQGVTIGGVAATIHEENFSPVNLSFRSAVVGRAVAAGTTATIAVTITSTGATSCAVTVYSIYDLDSTTPFHSNGSGTQTGTSVSTTLNIPFLGVAIAAITSADSGTAVSVSGLLEDVDVGNAPDTRVIAASRKNMAAETGRSISASGPNTGWALSCVSWA